MKIFPRRASASPAPPFPIRWPALMKTAFLLSLAAVFVMSICTIGQAAEPQLKIGVIGLDTSHAIAFTKELNSASAPPELANCRVIAAYPKRSADIESSTSRIPKYTEDVKQMDVEIVGSID